jgi:hypothetical protein
MPFGTATVVTNKGKAMFADRIRTTPATYTAAPKFAAMGNGATAGARTAAAADTALSAERESRVSGTESVVTTTNTGDTYQVVSTITATANYNSTGANAPIDEAGLFDASTAGNMFTSATFATVALATGDSIQFTWKVQLT